MFLVNRASDGGMKGRSLCVHTVENATSSSPEKKKKNSEVGKTPTRWTVEESECVFFFRRSLLSQDGGTPVPFVVHRLAEGGALQFGCVVLPSI